MSFRDELRSKPRELEFFEKRNFAVLTIPKCACSSFFMLDILDNRPDLIPKIKSESLDIWDDIFFKEYPGKFVSHRELPLTYPIYVVIRNPFDRVWPSYVHVQHFENKWDSFESCLHDLAQLQNSNPHFFNQLDYVEAYKHLEFADRIQVVRFEKISHFFESLTRNHGVPRDLH